MSDLTYTLFEPRTDDEYRAAIEALIGEMKRLHEQAQTNQDEIDRISREARLIQAQTATIKARTQTRLEALESLVPA